MFRLAFFHINNVHVHNTKVHVIQALTIVHLTMSKASVITDQLSVILNHSVHLCSCSCFVPHPLSYSICKKNYFVHFQLKQRRSLHLQSEILQVLKLVPPFK